MSFGVESIQITVKSINKKIEKKTYERETKAGKKQVRYAFRAVDDDGTNLTKFCSEADWNKL